MKYSYRPTWTSTWVSSHTLKRLNCVSIPPSTTCKLLVRF